jgi:membrane protein
MMISEMTKYITQFREHGMRSVDRINQLTGGWLGMIARAVKETRKPNAAITAAAIAYFALFSLFPLILLSISIASFNFGLSVDQQALLNRLEFIAPALGQLLGENIDHIIKARGPVSGIALVGLLWSASNVFYIFTDTLHEVWDVKHRRAGWKRRGQSILVVLMFVGPLLFFASIAGSILAYLRTFLPDTPAWMDGGISWTLAILLNIALFMVLYIMLPHGTATWREILPGAIGAGLLWELAKKAFLSFVSTYISTSNLVYGSVAAIIAFLAWAHISGLIFLFGAYLSVAYLEFKQAKKEIAA